MIWFLASKAQAGVSVLLGLLALLKARLSSRHLNQPTYSADGEDHARLAGTDTHKAVPELPIEKVFTDEGDETESHRCPQHVEDSCHVINVQLAAHDFVLLIVANASEPESFQLLHLPWKQGRKNR